MLCLAVFVFAVIQIALAEKSDYSVYLEEVSSIYLPSGTPQWDKGVAEKAHYDAVNKLLYVVGARYRHVISVKQPLNLASLRTESSSEGNTEYTDISQCGNYFIQTTDYKGDRPRGTFSVYMKFDASKQTQEIYTMTAGADPDSVKFTPDCTMAVVTVKGAAYGTSSTFTDPLGKIIIIKFPTPDAPGNFSDNVKVTTLDFTKFDSMANELVAKGVRFVFRERNNNFSNDVDPSSLTIDPDGKKAYVCLQRNNAIAVVDLVKLSITDIFPLGMKNWADLMMDASDKDGGINMKKWPIYSYYLPDGLEYLEFKGEKYLVTANEGSDRDYEDMIGWKEVMRGKEFVEKNLVASSVSSDMKTKLGTDAMLGRLQFTTQNGENTNDSYTKFVAFGGRSFSIWLIESKSVKPMYDSGDDIEIQHSKSHKDLFNSVVKDTPKKDADKRSDHRGPEPESIAIGMIDRLKLIFVGNERPGTIMVYSILDDIKTPKFEIIWASVRNTSATWVDLYKDRTLQGIDPEDLIFVPKEKSPTGKPALFVIGVTSGTVTLLNVRLSGTVPPASKASCFGSNILVIMIVTSLVQMLMSFRH